jgi:hypothetical protein
MPSADEITRQVEIESERRGVLAVPAFAGGFLYVLSAVIISATLKGAPTVGLIEGFSPALSGVANPAVSPRASEVKFISHHAFTLIVGSTLAAIAVGALTLILLLLVDATRFRRPAMWSAARPLVIFGGIAVAIVSVAHQIISAVETHNFAVGHDLSNHAVNQALAESTLNVVVEYLDLLAGLALATGVIATMINALRVGLVPRWMGILGIFSGVLIFLPLGGAELEVVPALWMVMMGILYAGRWPNAEPPAWAAGEARPWPSGAQARADRKAGIDLGDVAPAPALPVQKGTSRKRRKRG